MARGRFQASVLALGAATLVAACAHVDAPSTPAAPALHVAPFDEPPPSLAILEPAARASGTGASRGAFQGSVVAAGLWKLCADVSRANVLAGAVVCAVTLPVGVAAVPVGAVAGLAASVSASEEATPAGRAARTLPAPAWWPDARELLLAGVAARATELGFVVLRPHAVRAERPMVRVSIAAMGLEPAGGGSFRAFVTVRGGLAVHGVTISEEMLTRSGASIDSLDAWSAAGHDKLRGEVAVLTADASEALAGKLLFAHCEAVAAAQPGSDASICGYPAAAP